MKTVAVLALLCLTSDLAFAQAQGCQSTARAGDLLACYNGTAPTASPGRRAPSKMTTAAAKPRISQTPAKAPVDDDEVLANENQRLDTKVKSLCRGC